MRVEDLDPDRSRPEHERSQLSDLAAIGLDWDGEVVRQSQRTTLYEQALERLRKQDRVYECWCTRADIRMAAQAPHETLPVGAYPGTCRRLSELERSQRRRSGRPSALRLGARAEEVPFDDRLHGPVSGTVDDFVLRRSDGVPAYNLAVVVDDAGQGIGEVVRGDDLLDSTPRQILLARLLGAELPTHAHVPLVVAPDGTRLAKRHGAVTLGDRAQLGESPGDVVAAMAASLGLAEPGEPVTAQDLVARFDPARLPCEPWVFEGEAS
jgi:glutamyl-tRNA synthetase